RRPLREQCSDVGEQQPAGRELEPELRDFPPLRFALLSGRGVETRCRPDSHAGKPGTRTGEQPAHRGGGQSRSSTFVSLKKIEEFRAVSSSANPPGNSNAGSAVPSRHSFRNCAENLVRNRIS